MNDMNAIFEIKSKEWEDRESFNHRNNQGKTYYKLEDTDCP
jgi:hypothetical protein